MDKFRENNLNSKMVVFKTIYASASLAFPVSEKVTERLKVVGCKPIGAIPT